MSPAENRWSGTKVRRLHDRLLAAGPLSRVIGQVRGAAPGPTLLAVAGIHGNEPAGVLAARRVFERLERDGMSLRGDFTVLAGNVEALRRGVRGIDRDLNRGWRRDRLDAGSPAASSEDREQRELLRALDAARAAARGPITFLDLHSTSAPGIPFAMVRDLPEQRPFAEQFPLPILMGLHELVDSTLLEFMRREGCVALGIEAGQNDAESSIDHRVAVLWTGLATAGLLDPDRVQALERYRDQLAAPRGARRAAALDARRPPACDHACGRVPDGGGVRQHRPRRSRAAPGSRRQRRNPRAAELRPAPAALSSAGRRRVLPRQRAARRTLLD